MRFLRIVSAIMLLGSTPAFAAEPNVPVDTGAGSSECADKPEVCGRQAFERAVEAYRGGDFEAAIREFRAALGYKWHPSIALNLGLAESKSGHYLDAVREFDAVLASPASEAKLRDQATIERERASAELSAIELDAGEGAPPTVLLDGAPADVRVPVFVDPGAHHLEIQMPGGALVRRDVTLAPREHLRLAIDRTSEIVVVPSREPEKPKEVAVEPTPTARHRHGVAPLWFFVGAGAAVVAGGVATWSALDTKSAYDSYQRDLPKLGQAAANERVDDGHALETRTNVLWAVTGALAVGAAAVGVFLVEWHSSESALVVGPGRVAYRAHF